MNGRFRRQLHKIHNQVTTKILSSKFHQRFASEACYPFRRSNFFSVSCEGILDMIMSTKPRRSLIISYFKALVSSNAKIRTDLPIKHTSNNCTGHNKMELEWQIISLLSRITWTDIAISRSIYLNECSFFQLLLFFPLALSSLHFIFQKPRHSWISLQLKLLRFYVMVPPITLASVSNISVVV